MLYTIDTKERCDISFLHTDPMTLRSTCALEHRNIIKCVSSLMNNAVIAFDASGSRVQYGLKCVLSHPNSLSIIAQSLDAESLHIKIQVYN